MIEGKSLKLKNTILYLLERCPGITRSKLNKLLFFADFRSYRETAKSITNSIYIKKEFGPEVKDIDLTLAEMEQEGLIAATEGKDTVYCLPVKV
jgi:hypothetical protein